MKHLFVLLLATLITNTLADPLITVSPSSVKINQVSTYQFTFNVGTTSILPGTATIVFPSPAYNFNTSNGITSCYSTANSAVLFGCSIFNSSAFRFTWTVNMTEEIYMSINSITNPSYVDNYAVSFAFESSNLSMSFATINTSIKSLQPD